MEAFGTDFTLVLNVTCPDKGWYKSATSFGDLKLFPTDDPSHIFSGDPRITFELKSGLDKINYYYDDFENVEELTPAHHRRRGDGRTHLQKASVCGGRNTTVRCPPAAAGHQDLRRRH